MPVRLLTQAVDAKLAETARRAGEPGDELEDEHRFATVDVR